MDKIAILDDFSNEVSEVRPEILIEGYDPNAKKRKEYLQSLEIDSAIICFFQVNLVKEICKDLEFFTYIGNGAFQVPIFIYKKRTLIVCTTIGAPAACAVMEELNYYGVKRFIAFGSSGCIDENFDTSKLILVEKAIRDEGSSFHYLPPSLYVESTHSQNQMLENFLTEREVIFEKATTWTTDAIYRETKSRANERKNQGAVAVDMECSAWCAVAKAKNLVFSQILYFTDAVNQGFTKNEWNWIDKKENFDKVKLSILKLCLEFYMEK